MTTYAPLANLSGMNGNTGVDVPQAANTPTPIVGQLNAARLLNADKINANAGNPLPQSPFNPIPVPYGGRVIAILFPTVAGGGYGMPI